MIVSNKILVIDDNKDFADVFCDILKANEYEAETCYGGKEALEKTKEDIFDLVFLDIRMPEMDGVQTLKEIKKIKPEVKVIMMTGYSVDEMVESALEAKASGIIHKPFEIDKVLDMITNTP